MRVNVGLSLKEDTDGGCLWTKFWWRYWT